MLEKRTFGMLQGSLAVAAVWVVCIGMAAVLVMIAESVVRNSDTVNLGELVAKNLIVIVFSFAVLFASGAGGFALSSRIGKTFFAEPEIAKKQTFAVTTGLLGLVLGWIAWTLTQRAYWKPHEWLFLGGIIAFQCALVYAVNAVVFPDKETMKHKLLVPVLYVVLAILPSLLAFYIAKTAYGSP